MQPVRRMSEVGKCSPLIQFLRIRRHTYLEPLSTPEPRLRRK
jgi:hypothetical protein